MRKKPVVWVYWIATSLVCAGYLLGAAAYTFNHDMVAQADPSRLAGGGGRHAKGLDVAMRASRAKRIHLVPLELAADLPSIAFGLAKVGRLTAEQLRSLVDESRLKRPYPRQDFDAERFSEFHWLVVEEATRDDRYLDERAGDGAVIGPPSRRGGADPCDVRRTDQLAGGLPGRSAR